MCRAIGKGIMILLAGILIGTALLWGAYLIPMSEDSVHVVESVDILEQEGWYPTAPLMRQYVGSEIGRNGGGIMDNYTDSIMITTAGHDPVEGALYQAMNMAGDVKETGYSYYWHGYVAILRPLLLVLNYADIRVVNQLLQMIIVTAMACLLYRSRGAAYAALPLTVYGLLMPMAISQSLQYSWVFYIGMIGSLIIIQFRCGLSKGQRIYFFFLILGMLTSYLDLLTYPLFTWGIPMIWWVVTDDDSKGAAGQLWQVVLGGISWIFGYGGLWAGKWVVGQIVTGQPVIAQAWYEVLYRAGRSPDAVGYSFSYQESILRNLLVCISVQTVFLLGAWMIWWCYKAVRKSYLIRKEKTLALLLVASSPIVWYMALHDHTHVHNNFTYRIFMIGITALLASMIHCWETEKPRGYRLEKSDKVKRIIPAVMVFTAFLIAFNMKDETYIHNGGYKETVLELAEEVECIQEFHPSFDRIGFMNIWLCAENGESGEIDVKIREKGGKTLWEYSLSAGDVAGGTFYEFPVKLHLDRRKTYQICMEGRDLGENRVYSAGAGEGLHPLTELSSLQIGDLEYDTQLTFGVLYRYQANLLKILFTAELVLLISWNLYLFADIVVRWSVRKRSGLGTG